MDKFKKAINQLNEPIDGKNKGNKKAGKAASAAQRSELTEQPKLAEKQEKATAQSVADEPVKEVKATAAEETAEKTEAKQEAVEPAETASGTEDRPAETGQAIDEKRAKSEDEMSEYEKELERQYYSVRSEDKHTDGKKEKKAKRKRVKEKAEKKPKSKKEKKPAENTTAKPEKKSHGIRTIVIILLIALVAIGCFANYRLNNRLTPVFYQVQSNKVVDNVRIVAISDMHLKEFGPDNERLVNKIKSYYPDIIAILGDMNIDKNPDYSKVLNLCARLNEVAPLYYALGNHEFEVMLFEDSQIYYDLRAAGIKVLNNEMETIEVGLSKIDVIGITQKPNRFRTDAKKFFDKAMENDDNFKLVLTHYPENFQGVMEEYPIDLALCGHAHGGQVRLPIIGGLYSSDQGILPELCDGYHEIENSKVIISKGLGRSGVVPRINNPPEITIVDINWY